MLECSQIGKKYDLSFEECIYAIAFDLEDDLAERGKEAVFSELPNREQMADYVQVVLEDEFRKRESCALKKVLADKPIPEDVVFDNPDHAAGDEGDVLRCSHNGTLEENYRNAVEKLREKSRIRRRLVGGENFWRRYRKTLARLACSVSECSPTDSVNSDLYNQMHRLITKLRMMDAERDQILAQLESLIAVTGTQNTNMLSLTAINPVESKPETKSGIDLEGSILQLEWSIRSQKIFEQLKITTIPEAVAYFSDFDHFIKSKNLSYWEWSVIVVTLWRQKQLSSEYQVEIKFDASLEEFLDDCGAGSMPVRTHNSLTRSGVTGDIQGLFELFSAGAWRAWDKLNRTRNFGKVSKQYLIQKMADAVIMIPPELCVPNGESSVAALELDNSEIVTLERYHIKTIDDLATACKDQNRFLGLRYINPSMYKYALEKLEEYGF